MKLQYIYEKGKRPEATRPEKVYKLVKSIKDKEQEMLLLLCLDTRLKVISKNIVTIGTLDASMIHPRDVFRIAIANNSKHIILAHNHPSGDTTPSTEDIEITEQIQEAGELLDITLLDHIIVGEGFKSIMLK